MRRARLALACFVLIALAGSASAQSLPSSPADSLFVEPLSPEQERELDAWLSAVEEFQRYQAKNLNRPARDYLGRIAERRALPAAPSWLNAYCAAAKTAGVVDLQQRTAEACRLLADPQVDPGRAQAQAATEKAEKPPKHSWFLTRVHLDGLWISTSSDSRGYGIVGSHVTLVDVGRVQLFGPPGVLLVSLPEASGQRRVTLGYTWGLSVRLADVRLNWPTTRMTVFLTVSKVWVNGSRTPTPETGGYQFAGLSIAPRRGR